jgi:hypothetical protein
MGRPTSSPAPPPPPPSECDPPPTQAPGFGGGGGGGVHVRVGGSGDASAGGAAGALGTQFTCFTGTNVRILTQTALVGAAGGGERGRASERVCAAAVACPAPALCGARRRRQRLW